MQGKIVATKIIQLAKDVSQKYNLALENLSKIVAIGSPEYQELCKQISLLEPIRNCYAQYQNIAQDLKDAQEIQELNDHIGEFTAELDSQLKKLQCLIVDLAAEEKAAKIYLEIRSGAGGLESSLFNVDLVNMYLRYAQKLNFNTEICSCSYGDANSIKEIVIKISGNGCEAAFAAEAGVHRVQRVPLTEKRGRVHTSTSSVAVIPDNPAHTITLKPAELRVDSFRSSGAGGQSVNTTDSAIRIVHLPTGIKAECQNERSQRQNKEAALLQLQAKLQAHYIAEQSKECNLARKSQIGTSQRSEKIRTYNFAQNRVTDHRCNYSINQLDLVLAGNLANLHQALYSVELMAKLDHARKVLLDS